MAKKKLENPSDFKGITFRGAGYSPLILQEPEFGGSGVIIATGDVYTALQTGVIDACEVSNAFGNFASGYHEVTKYWSFPGIHQLTQASSLIVNLDVWNKVPEDVQWIIRSVCAYNMMRSWSFNHLESAKIIPRLQKEFGIVIYRESPETQKTWRDLSFKISEGFAAKSADFKAMWDNHKNLMATLAPYEELQTVTYAK